MDTDVFAENRYFDVTVEYAKNSPEDILVRIRVTNHGPDRAQLDLLPTIWFRNTWSCGTGERRPVLGKASASAPVIELRHPQLGTRRLAYDGTPNLLFTENETNFERLYGVPNGSLYVKDGINDYVVDKASHAVNPAETGTKAAAHYQLTLAPGETATIRLWLVESLPGDLFGPTFDRIFTDRKREADEFYATVIPAHLSPDAKNVMRQSFAGMLWSKQFYHYVVRDWLQGDPVSPPPPSERQSGRNHEWLHLYNADVISMPDKWEYPWYAAWDLAFHCVPLALVDAEFAKQQLLLMLREWYMHPNGQLPAYEWAFGDVNPPVHAWAAWRV